MAILLKTLGRKAEKYLVMQGATQHLAWRSNQGLRSYCATRKTYPLWFLIDFTSYSLFY